MGEQPGHEAEELLDVGSHRAPHWAGWLRRWQARRGLLVLVGLLMLAVVGTVSVARSDSGRHGRDAAPVPSSPTPSPTPAPTTSLPLRSTQYVDNEYLIAVPAVDMRAEITRCGRTCSASTLAGRGLDRTVDAFPGAHALAGGTVSQHGTLVLRTVEADLGAAGLAHLTVRRERTPAVPTTVRTEPGDGYRTITVTAVRAGCRFTAVVVTRTADAPGGAARNWVMRTPSSCRSP